MKIAFCGRMASGKTTLATHLCDTYGFQKFSLATKVKEVATTICGMKAGEKDRRLLQTIGHEMRRILYEDVWVDAVLRETQGIENAVIDDVRYGNEFIALKNAGWILVRLDISPQLQERRLRCTYPDTCESHLENIHHASETSLDGINVKAFDYSINVDDPASLRSFVKCLHEHILVH